MERIYEEITGLSFGYFQQHPATPETIRDFIRRMTAAYPEHHIDEVRLFNHLEAIHSVTVEGDARILDDLTGHEEWFNPDTNLPLHRDFEWHFWEHYKQYVSTVKKWPTGVVASLDRFSSLALARIEDPKRDGPWDRRGMVVGDVQSGKTSNYTALLTKAADAGYKLFVVMAGVHNSLRSQTQDRINEEFLGYDLEKIQKLTGQERRIGVRRLYPHHCVVNTLTSSAENGDFRTAVAKQAGIIPSLTGDPIVLVVKKNVTILKNLIQWATGLSQRGPDGRAIVHNIPFMLIDDECDYASVNTKKPERDENGRIVEEWDPAKTNLLIRQLLSSFDKSVYVGYTATPYANIFIHNDDPHPVYGDDIFPKHFLISLPQPSNYIGPDKLFGLKGDPDLGIDAVEPLPLLEEVDDNEKFIPEKHKSDLQITGLPDSLVTAVKSFVLVCAARRLRQAGTPHNSMLIHVTRFTRVQGQVKDLIEELVKTLTARIMSGTDELRDFREIWEQNFVPVSRLMKARGFGDALLHSWDQVCPELYAAVRGIRIRGINGEIGDTLEYREAELRVRERRDRGEETPWVERGVSVIAVGGDKLSRGLTLDGLSVSYYLRAARMYDTLMQMGRWFGYRDGYNDLCRIFTTVELTQWYQHIALANSELRDTFEYMVAIKSSPEKFGLKVRSHPGRLAITSAGKSRAAEKMRITFAGEFPKTVVFDPRHSANNRNALERMIEAIGRHPDRKVDQRKPRFHWESVEPEIVTEFLRHYRTQETASKVVNPAKIADFVEKQSSKGELKNWHVVIVSNANPKHSIVLGGLEIGCVQRTPLHVDGERIAIGTLISPADEAADLSPEELENARIFDRIEGQQDPGEDGLPRTKTIRKFRPKTRGH